MSESSVFQIHLELESISKYRSWNFQGFTVYDSTHSYKFYLKKSKQIHRNNTIHEHCTHLDKE